MKRIEFLLRRCEECGLFERGWNETDQEAAIRLFRQYWNGDDFWLEILAAGCDSKMIELITLGQGILWVADEPIEGMEIPLPARKEQFLRLLLGASFKPQTLVA